jgi:hypothetical protein
MDMATANIPEKRALLNEARGQYRNLKTLEPLIAKSQDGFINPSLLQGAVTNTKKAKTNQVRGRNGDLGELAKVGQLIKDNVPNSGTASRLSGYAGFGLGAGAVVNPFMAAAPIVAAKSYNTLNNSQRLVRNALKPSNSSVITANTPTAIIANQAADTMSYNPSQEPQQDQETKQQITNFEPLGYTQPKQVNGYLQKLAKAESGNNPNAKNPTSTATGKYQFTKGTWNSLVDKYGSEAGVSKADILNPQAQDIMIGYLDKENSDALSAFLGREPNEAEKYMAHFMGINQAKKLIENADSTEPAYKMFSKEARFNKNIFYDKKMRPLTVNQVYEKLSDIIG